MSDTARTRYWFDTEFMEDGRTIELLSIGVVCDDGREFYAENRYANLTRANDWVKENVIPHLAMSKGDKQASGALTPQEIAANLIDFVADGRSKPEFWAYYGDYDWVVLCQLYGRMIDLPNGWPMFAMDVKQLCVSLGDPRLPEQADTEHNALNDARWTRQAWEFLMERVDPALSIIRSIGHRMEQDQTIENIGWDDLTELFDSLVPIFGLVQNADA